MNQADIDKITTICLHAGLEAQVIAKQCEIHALHASTGTIGCPADYLQRFSMLDATIERIKAEQAELYKNA